MKRLLYQTQMNSELWMTVLICRPINFIHQNNPWVPFQWENASLTRPCWNDARNSLLAKAQALSILLATLSPHLPSQNAIKSGAIRVASHTSPNHANYRWECSNRLAILRTLGVRKNCWNFNHMEAKCGRQTPPDIRSCLPRSNMYATSALRGFLEKFSSWLLGIFVFWEERDNEMSIINNKTKKWTPEFCTKGQTVSVCS